ncbi:MAG: ATPase [Desulfuromonas sp.]|nr:MAG: ATPase [Desulfuromonas sp.]
MADRHLGEQLVERKAVTEEQLGEALARQRMHGGRLGNNLVACGFLSEEELDAFFHQVPLSPKSLDETGLDFSFVFDLAMKHAAQLGSFSLGQLSDGLKLPVTLIEPVLEEMRKKHYLEVKGASSLTKASWTFTVSEKGKGYATELRSACRYAGPAPVTLDAYRRQVEQQTIKSIMVGQEAVSEAFRELIVGSEMLSRLGPAISSGRSIFLYGPPGNGKTTVAEAIGELLPDHIYIPHALLVGGEIINLYDPVSHRLAPAEEASEEKVDRRWLHIRRPVIMVGGEFTLDMLNLDFNPIAKFYQGSLQLKANNGLFIVDDFGRQQMDPQNLLNRWIVPLERRTDFLSLHTGMKFEIPFDQLVIFSTNIEPEELVDEAFLRRIRYKIMIDHPSLDEYEQIFRRVCSSNGIEFREEVFEHLLENYYDRLDVRLNACHPRDIVDHLIDDAHYRGEPPLMTVGAIADAWKSYFVTGSDRT